MVECAVDKTASGRDDKRFAPQHTDTVIRHFGLLRNPLAALFDAVCSSPSAVDFTP